MNQPKKGLAIRPKNPKGTKEKDLRWVPYKIDRLFPGEENVYNAGFDVKALFDAVPGTSVLKALGNKVHADWLIPWVQQPGQFKVPCRYCRHPFGGRSRLADHLLQKKPEPTVC